MLLSNVLDLCIIVHASDTCGGHKYHFLHVTPCDDYLDYEPNYTYTIYVYIHNTLYTY